jgi:beta-galactosidase/beta-glucuronidase
MSVHRIHLKGPWEFEWLGPDSLSPSAGPARSPGPEDQLGAQHLAGKHRVHMPATWQSLFGDAPGRARFRRRFNQPTNLDADERVDIVFDGVSGAAEISLNGHSLGTVAGAAFSARFETTALLESANVLLVELAFTPADHPEQPGGLWAPVALEIRSGQE